jgi:hypothetical protein
VEFDSIVGAGTTFRLRLPAAAVKTDLSVMTRK